MAFTGGEGDFSSNIRLKYRVRVQCVGGNRESAYNFLLPGGGLG